jgi:hypothetical protein
MHIYNNFHYTESAEKECQTVCQLLYFFKSFGMLYSGVGATAGAGDASRHRDRVALK